MSRIPAVPGSSVYAYLIDMTRLPVWVWIVGALILMSGGAVVSTTLAKRREIFRPLFDSASAQYGIPPGLLMRQGEVESALDPNAINKSSNATGIMQIVPRWHPEVGVTGALDPARAIPYAAKILRQWRDQFGSWELALAAYNAGPANVQKYGGIPPFEETRNYIAKILG